MKLRKLKRFGRRPRRKSFHQELENSEDESEENLLEKQKTVEIKSDDEVIERIKRESEVSKPDQKTVNERSANWNHPSNPG